ncbi:MAG TPA: hypothetical protein VHG70_07985 [Nocardioidaceae bacterium]|nr:hypothetical protein [Nocardioidaceae bacterium]
MQPENDFEQVKRQVFDAAKRMLVDRRPEQPPVTTGDIAGELGLEMPLVVKAVQSLATDHLQVAATEDWQVAEIQRVSREY